MLDALVEGFGYVSEVDKVVQFSDALEDIRPGELSLGTFFPVEFGEVYLHDLFEGRSLGDTVEQFELELKGQFLVAKKRNEFFEEADHKEGHLSDL